MKNEVIPFISGSFYINDTLANPVPVSYGQRTVKQWEFELITAGKGYIITDGENIETKAGRLFVRKPGMIVEGIRPYSCYNVTFNYSGTDLDILSVFYDNMEFLIPNFNELRQRDQLSDAASHFEVYAQFCHILSSVLIRHRNIMPDKILESVRSIENGLRDPISAVMLAEQAGYSLNHYIRLFKDYTGETPNAYILHKRIEKACILLENTDDIAESISRECGFKNTSYFFRSFRRIMNMTPGDYRKSRRYQGIL